MKSLFKLWGQEEKEIVETSMTCKEIISASYRTDIPGQYMPQMLKWIRQKWIDVPNPRFPDKISRVSLDPKDVKVIAWWSKNYQFWIAEWLKSDSPLATFRYHYFNFTINGESHELEPGLDHLSLESDILDQLKFLVEEFGPAALNVRFDPIVHFRFLSDPPMLRRYNLSAFETIVEALETLGIPDLTFSFCVDYQKTVRRMRQRGNVLITLDATEKREVLDSLLEICQTHGVILKSCCDSGLVDYVGKRGGIVMPSVCIDGDKLAALGVVLKSKKKGKRRAECECQDYQDIGNYQLKCAHSCAYCYANPTESHKRKEEDYVPEIEDFPFE